MRRVKGNKAHSLQNSVFNPFCNLIGHFAVLFVPPPYKHVGVVKRFVIKTEIRHIKRCGFNLEIIAFSKSFGYRSLRYGVQQTGRAERDPEPSTLVQQQDHIQEMSGLL